MFVCFPTTSDENGAKTIAWDSSFLKTIPGRLKLAAIITNFIVFICVVVSEVSHIPPAKWANFVAWMGLLITAQFLIFHLLRITQVYDSIPWWKFEMGFAILWAFFFLTVSIDLAMKAANYERMCAANQIHCGHEGNSRAKSFAPATFFGLVAMAIYGSEAWIIFKQWQVEQFMEEMDNRNGMYNPDPFGDTA